MRFQSFPTLCGTFFPYQKCNQCVLYDDEQNLKFNYQLLTKPFQPASDSYFKSSMSTIIKLALQDFEEDVDLRQTLEDFLRQLVSKSYNEESLEVKLAQQLLE